MQPEIKKYLQDINEAVKEIENFVSGKDYALFEKDSMIQSAIERKFEIIGEALNRISKIDPKLLEEIRDYKRIIGFRNVISHGYDIVDSEIVWDAIEYSLPKLKEDVSKLLENQMNNIAVLICVYKNDRVSFLKESLESLLNQTYQDFDIFLKIDGPVDRSLLEYLYSIQDSRLNILKRKECRF